MKQEQESLANRRSMALNERQCSVSEIVLMHENKNQLKRSADRSATIDGSAIANATAGNDGMPDCSVSGHDILSSQEDVLPDKSINYLNCTVESIQSIQQPNHRSAVSSASESSRLSSETGLSCFDASSTLSSASNDTKQSNDEIAIRTYAGLSATTQERIRRFEQETKAMLQRDQNRQRREAERREEERRRIEMEWQLAKREMENDDLLDDIVDTTVTTAAYAPSTNRLSSFTDKSFFDISPRSSARVQPLSIAVQQQPTSVRRVSQLADDLAVSLPPENVSSTVMKKMKTDREVTNQRSPRCRGGSRRRCTSTSFPRILQQASSEPLSLPPIRYGSLDSLHETQDASHSSLSPTNQQRKPLSGDVSDDGQYPAAIYIIHD